MKASQSHVLFLACIHVNMHPKPAMHLYCRDLYFRLSTPAQAANTCRSRRALNHAHYMPILKAHLVPIEHLFSCFSENVEKLKKKNGNERQNVGCIFHLHSSAEE